MKKLILILITFFTASTAFAGLDDANIYMLPRPTPDKTFSDEFKNEISLNSFKGKFVIGVFWSRYCGPCIKEMPSLNNFNNIVKNNGIKVIAISPDYEWASPEEHKKFAHKYGATDIDLFLDKGGALAGALGLYRYPNSVLINVNGEEIGRIKGAMVWDNPEVIEYFYNLKAKTTKAINEIKPVMNVDKIKSDELPDL